MGGRSLKYRLDCWSFTAESNLNLLEKDSLGSETCTDCEVLVPLQNGEWDFVTTGGNDGPAAFLGEIFCRIGEVCR